MTTRINGRTRLAGIVGWPLDHSLSPAMHNAVYKAMDIDAVYIPLPVRNEQELQRVISAVRVLPFFGLNVTMPFKQTVFSMCDQVATQAQVAGAVNVVQCKEGRLIGYNTDGRGLLESLADEAGFEVEGKRVAMVGAGGAAGAAVVAFVSSRAERVAVVNRSVERAEQLVARVAPHSRATELAAVDIDAGESEIRSADLVVNATPAGMNGSSDTPFPVEWLHAGQVVADMVYRPAVTPLMEAARRAGATAIGGLGMLVAQGAMAVDFWLCEDGRRARRDVMRAAAEEVLAREEDSR